MTRLKCYLDALFLSPFIKKTLSELDPLWQNFLDLRMANGYSNSFGYTTNRPELIVYYPTDWPKHYNTLQCMHTLLKIIQPFTT